MMQLILTKRVPKLGQKWDVVTVKNGYARNFLLPHKLAEAATPKKLELARKHAEERVKKMDELMLNAKETAEKLSKAGLVFKKKAKGEKLYGSITEKDIAEALKKDYKLEIDEKTIQLKTHLKELGEHKVMIELTEGVEAEISVKIEEEK